MKFISLPPVKGYFKSKVYPLTIGQKSAIQWARSPTDMLRNRVFVSELVAVKRNATINMEMSTSEKPLKMVTCSGCEAKVFIPGNLPPLATEPCKRCGHPIMMPMQLRQFELRSKIASGGQGKVYRAFDNVLERMVAVKLMRKELENDTVALESFYREARACASLNHTNIIHIYSFDEFENQRYLVMELADRSSLDARIEKQQRLS